jgi:hypothetical protein
LKSAAAPLELGSLQEIEFLLLLLDEEHFMHTLL